MDELEEAKRLLIRAQIVLGRYWFSSDGEDERNNDEVIAMDREIEAFLERPSQNSQTED